MKIKSEVNVKSRQFSNHEAYEKHLRKSNAEWFRKRAFAVNNRLPYILENWQDWPKNILVSTVAEYIRGEKEHSEKEKIPFSLHKYIHHGLSSQAMLFNLVGPLIIQNDVSPLKAAFDTAGINWPVEIGNPRFEVVNREIFNETSGQPTSIDLVIGGEGIPHSVYVEAKLVEHEFGGCSVFQNGDCDGRNPCADFNMCYLHQISRKYWTLLEKHGFLQGAFASGPICPLAAYYQFFREVVFAIESGGDFVLLYDQRNPTFFRPTADGQRGIDGVLEIFCALGSSAPGG